MLDDDIEFDDEACPKCGHSPTHSRQCSVVGCDDGWIDMHEYDDPLFFDEGETEMCEECSGTGWLRWCPSCGYDLQRARLTQREADVCQECGKIETIDPNNDGVVVCVECGTRR
jgi:hypothetical protein